MSPEFGATATLFPIDDETLAYLRLTGRPTSASPSSSATPRSRGCGASRATDRRSTRSLTLDLSTIEPSVAGPRRPQDRVPLTGLRANFRTNFPDGLGPAAPPPSVVEEASDASFPASDPPSFVADEAADAPTTPAVSGAVDAAPDYRAVTIEVDGQSATIRTGSVAIAAITSCTNTSNPTVMVGAGLLARNAVARGLTGRRRPSRPRWRRGRRP